MQGLPPDDVARLRDATDSLAATEATRQRAQQTATIALGLVVAFVGTGVLGAFNDRPWWIVVLAFFALFFSLAAVFLFMRAVADISAGFLDVEHVEHEDLPLPIRLAKLRRHSATKARAALITTAIAIALGLIALFVARAVGPQQTRAKVHLQGTAHTSVEKLCGKSVEDPFPADVVIGELDSAFVTLSIPAGDCRDVDVDVHVARADVLAVRNP